MPSVQEILFIDTKVMRIQLYRRETSYWTMRNFTHDDNVELTSLNIHFSVAEAYEKTTFDNGTTSHGGQMGFYKNLQLSMMPASQDANSL